MMGCVRLCRYSMPLATSTAMINLDCRSRILYFVKKIKDYLKLIDS